MSESDNPFLALNEEKVYNKFNIGTRYLQIIDYAENEEDTLLLIDNYANEV